MRWPRHLLLVAVTASTAAADDTDRRDYKLPGGADAPVITLDYRSDRMRRISDAPTLSILRDGSVIMPKIYAHSRAHQGEISQDELQDLLDLIIRQNKFFDYNHAAVSATTATRPTRRRSVRSHDVTTEIRVSTNSASKKVQVTQTELTAQLSETTQLQVIERRLARLMNRVKLGGTAKANRWLDQANSELSGKYPDATPLTLDHLDSVALRSDGSINVRFQQSRVGPEATWVVVIYKEPGGINHISVAQIPPPANDASE